MAEKSIATLAIELKQELKYLGGVVKGINDFLEQAPSNPDEIQIQSIGRSINGCTNHAENIFRRIAECIDGERPAGSAADYHLLQQMVQPFGSKRPAVIDRLLAAALAEQIHFRRKYLYPHDFEWLSVVEVARMLPVTLQMLTAQVEVFLATLHTSAVEAESSQASY